MSSSTLSPELTSAIEIDDFANFKILLEDLKQRNGPVYELNKLLDHAIQHNAIHIMDHLLALGVNPYSIEPWRPARLLRLSCFPAFQHLIRQGNLRINEDLDLDGSYLVLAVVFGNREQVSFCLEHGADPNLGWYFRIFCPLAAAARFDASIEVMEMLLKSGAEIKGSDALQVSAKYNRVDLIKLLLEHGADIDEIGFKYYRSGWYSDLKGSSALHLAVDDGSVEAIKFLLKEGANATLKDGKGRTAAERGAEKGSDAALRVLQAVSIAPRGHNNALGSI